MGLSIGTVGCLCGEPDQDDLSLFFFRYNENFLLLPHLLQSAGYPILSLIILVSVLVVVVVLITVSKLLDIIFTRPSIRVDILARTMTI